MRHAASQVLVLLALLWPGRYCLCAVAVCKPARQGACEPLVLQHVNEKWLGCVVSI